MYQLPYSSSRCRLHIKCSRTPPSTFLSISLVFKTLIIKYSSICGNIYLPPAFFFTPARLFASLRLSWAMPLPFTKPVLSPCIYHATRPPARSPLAHFYNLLYLPLRNALRVFSQTTSTCARRRTQVRLVVRCTGKLIRANIKIRDTSDWWPIVWVPIPRTTVIPFLRSLFLVISVNFLKISADLGAHQPHVRGTGRNVFTCK